MEVGRRRLTDVCLDVVSDFHGVVFGAEDDADAVVVDPVNR